MSKKNSTTENRKTSAAYVHDCTAEQTYAADVSI